MAKAEELDDNAGDYAPIDEARAAIEALTDDDYVKLMVIARYFARSRLRGGEEAAEDLLSQALTKTLKGPRRWRKSVSILKHLDRVMESDSSHAAKKLVSVRMVALPVGAKELRSNEAKATTRVDASDEIQEIFAMFAGDERAKEMLQLKGNGYSPEEIRVELSLSQTEYETTARRIQRKLAKYRTEKEQTNDEPKG